MSLGHNFIIGASYAAVNIEISSTKYGFKTSKMASLYTLIIMSLPTGLGAKYACTVRPDAPVA